MIQVNIINTSDNPEPFYATNMSAGMDLHASNEEEVLLRPTQRALVPTGLFIELPEGYEAQIRPRSGLAYRHGITVLNAPGTIDSDYRGEIKVLLINLGAEPYIIQKGERIAQMVIAAHERVEWQTAEVLGATDRGARGFGHTGN